MFKTFRKKIGIIGYGNMGSAIGRRLRCKYRVFVFDKDQDKLKAASGIRILKSASDVARRADCVILAVKPQDFEQALKEINPDVHGKLIISIAAGITTRFVESILGPVKVIRTMPNIGAIAGNSLTYVCAGKHAQIKDMDLARRLFRDIGAVLVISEDMVDAGTAVGGSGPGYWGFLFDKLQPQQWQEYEKEEFIPQLTQAATSVGFDKEKARLSAKYVCQAAASAMKALGISASELARRVSSKGGTTEAGIEALKKGATLTDAVKAALQRAKELAEAK